MLNFIIRLHYNKREYRRLWAPLFCNTSSIAGGRIRCSRREGGPDPGPLVGREDRPVVGELAGVRHPIRSLATEPGAARCREIVAEIHSESCVEVVSTIQFKMRSVNLLRLMGPMAARRLSSLPVAML